MNDLKNRIYNYETTPPQGVWEDIIAELDRNEAKIIPLSKKNNHTVYYVAAASVTVILFCILFFTNKNSKSDEFVLSETNNDSALNNNLMTIPIEEKSTVNNIDTAVLLAQNKGQKGGPNQKIIKTDNSLNISDSNLLSNNINSRYMIIEGPQGQPVKVSSKMALLIDSAETKDASKPIWNKKINEWREIMKGNTLAPTPGNFLDIVELTKSLKDNK